MVQVDENVDRRNAVSGRGTRRREDARELASLVRNLTKRNNAGAIIGLGTLEGRSVIRYTNGVAFEV